jgi:nitrate/nitrite-specific signal transduction histidine kinase
MVTMKTQVQTLENERRVVAHILGEETAQVLGCVLIQLAALRENEQFTASNAGIDDVRDAVRDELRRILQLASVLRRPAGLDDGLADT